MLLLNCFSENTQPVMAKNHDEITKLKNFYLTESTNGFKRIKQQFEVGVKQLKLFDATALMRADRSKRTK